MENHIGSRIRTLRRLQKRTLNDIAKRCDFTVGLLSKIEAGKTNPPVSTLTKIASALGLGLVQLLDESGQETTSVFRASDLQSKPFTPTDKGYAFHLLAAQRKGKAMQPFLFEAKKGEIQPGALSHFGEEFVYVLEGKMKYRVGNTTYDLSQGDSVYFDAEADHDLEPISDVVRFLAVFSERKRD